MVRLTCKLCAKSSQSEQVAKTQRESARQVPGDLHLSNFLLPLLVRALCSIRYVQLGMHQKRVAWHAARQIATAICSVLQCPPVEPPALDAQHVHVNLRLARGFPFRECTSDPTSISIRLGGGEGVTRLNLSQAARSR